MIKGILLDIDNTLINSKQAYRYALDQISLHWKTRYMGKSDFLEAFEYHKKIVKERLPGVPTNRNRLLVFKEMGDLGLLPNSPNDLLDLEQDYFRFFKEKIESQLKTHASDYANLFQILRDHSRNKRIVLLSNESLRTQLQKLSWFFPNDIPYLLLTSEEVGVEKPAPTIFQTALKKTELTPEEVVMIGDSFEDDMMGAVQMGIQPYHLKSIFGEKKITESNDRSFVIKEFYNLIHLLETLA